MEIKLTHRFTRRCYDKSALLVNCNKLSTFCSRLEKQAQSNLDRFSYNDYVGDGLEGLVEALVKLSPVDNRIGITDYQVATGQDTGVDGHGIGFNGKPATLQVKYRGDGTARLTANEDHLSNFICASQNRYGVMIEDTMNMLVVTTAEGLNFFTEEQMLYKKVRCLGRQELRSLVDNNQAFWDQFRKLMAVDPN